MNYILDTNILLYYIRNNEITQRLEDKLQLLNGDNNLVLSVVSVGEIRAIARQNKWGNKKNERLTRLLNKFLISEIKIESIIEKYAEISTFSQGKHEVYKLNDTSRNMGKNDLWIAATASVFNLQLLTTDNDFNHLKDIFININQINISGF